MKGNLMDNYGNRNAVRSRLSVGSPRQTVQINRIGLTNASPRAFMLLSTKSSCLPSIHTQNPILLKQKAALSTYKSAFMRSGQSDLKIVAKKIDINLKFRMPPLA